MEHAKLCSTFQYVHKFWSKQHVLSLFSSSLWIQLGSVNLGTNYESYIPQGSPRKLKNLEYTIISIFYKSKILNIL